MKLIAEGAEAKIYRDKNRVIKHRIQKKYRLLELDVRLRNQRNKSEGKLLSKVKNTPKVFEVDSCRIRMEYIDGIKLRDYIDRNTKDVNILFSQLGRDITKMHKDHIIHGDLTTSNMIFKDKKIYLIDFGLGKVSHKDEDKAVDLHLLRECLISKHNDIWKSVWNNFVKNYNNKSVLDRLKVVESRGRYKRKALKTK